jgi:hypothetical protein
MRRVDGRPLSAAVDDARTLEARLALLPHVVALCDALAYAHKEGFIHRDLKPANVLVGAFGDTVIIDWGLAKRVGEPDELEADVDEPGDRENLSSDLTVSGRAIGTPWYMPPEQARGEPADRRADVYALGALLYHVLTGAPPYGGTSGERALELVLDRAPDPVLSREPRLPKELAAIVERAMARDPAARYPDAVALAEDLEAFTRGARTSRRRRRVLVATAIVAVVAAVATAVGARSIFAARDRADEQQAVAERERRATQDGRDAAQRLVEDMLIDLRGKLAEIGRLEALAELAPAIETVLEALPVSDRLGASFEALGDTDRAANRPDAARRYYERSHDIWNQVGSEIPASLKEKLK